MQDLYSCTKTNSIISIESCKINRDRANKSDIGELICCINCTDYLDWGKEEVKSTNKTNPKLNSIVKKLGFNNNKELALFCNVHEQSMYRLLSAIKNKEKLSRTNILLLEKMAKKANMSIEELIGYIPRQVTKDNNIQNETLPESKNVQTISPKLDIFTATIEKFGNEAQLRQAQEECAELIVAINKYFRTQNSENIAEEIADIEIMLAQIKLIFNNAELIEIVKAYKLARLKERVYKAVS